MPSLTHRDIIEMMEPVGEIAPGPDGLVVTLHSTDPRPAVYAWVDGDEVLYIGKAGRNLRARSGNWRAGFRGTSGRGSAQAQVLRERGRLVTWMAFWPEPLLFRGQEIASHSSVEEWLIASTDPTPIINRRK